jgi:ABC-type multidrug transport system ATPase subunit/pSer/pThr/pTyr-binding forkhead associated (FHA) protein
VIIENTGIRNIPLDVRSRWTFGRGTPAATPDISVSSAIVGRKHGELFFVDGQWYYLDRGSVNGTYYNGQKIAAADGGEAKPVPLCNGDILRVDSDSLDFPDDRGVWMLFTTVPLGDEWNRYSIKGKEETIIGRDPEQCDLVLPLPYISAVHAKIGNANGHYFVMDCGSLAGTWLNDQKLEHGTVLNEKDKLVFCDCMMILLGDELIYNINSIGTANSRTAKRLILKADIQTKKVPNNSGPGEKELIRDVNVEVKEGSLVALLGSSGAGKTTVMNCLNGMDVKGVKGSVLFKGEDLLVHFERMKYLIGSVPQEEVFHPMLTVEEELMDAAVIRLPSDTKKSEIKKHVDDTIAQLNLENVRKNKISKCSGGEKKRVNIAIELVADRQLLCLDEPDAGLDPGMKKELFTILARLAHEEGKSILVIIHDVSEIDMFDQIIMMTKLDNVGRLAFSGTPDEARAYFGAEMKDAYRLLAENPGAYVKGAH